MKSLCRLKGFCFQGLQLTIKSFQCLSAPLKALREREKKNQNGCLQRKVGVVKERRESLGRDGLSLFWPSGETREKRRNKGLFVLAVVRLVIEVDRPTDTM